MVELPAGSEEKKLGSGSAQSMVVGLLSQLNRLSKLPLGVYAMAAILLLLLSLIYDMVLRASLGSASFEAIHSRHIAINVAVSALCLIALIRTKGDLRRRFETAIIGVLVNFGLFVMIITLFRLYFSRPVLIVSFLGSIALVTIMNLLLEKYRERRIGVIPQGIDEQKMARIGADAKYVVSPAASAKEFDVILVDWTQITDPRWMQFATSAALSGCEVRHYASYFEAKHGRVLAEYFETDHAQSFATSRYLNGYKRTIDIGLVLLVLPIALTILAVASLLILVTMGRPIFFTQDRLGMNGRQFKMYKLRSMVAASSAENSTATAIGDPRITPLGKVLRRFRIDEIPQFYNILLGDMSLVGPRPEQPELAHNYTAKLPAFRCRTLLKPGITGWAQVRGGYASDEAETEEKLSYDLYYLKNASFTTDLSIVIQTCKTLATGNSAR